MPTKRSRQNMRSRLWGAPEPADFKKTRVGRILGEAAKIHFKSKRDIDRLLAVEKLAIDIFSDSASARAFATNPKEYMAQGGFRNVNLDLNSYEVRVAMAMGDPKVREAAALGDLPGFVRAVMDQGLTDLEVGVTGAFVALEIVAAGSVITYQAVLTRILAVTRAIAVTKMAVVTETEAIGFGGGTVVEHQIKMLSRMAEDLGRPDLAKAVRTPKIRKILEQYLEIPKKIG
jgi:hypothetical protein